MVGSSRQSGTMMDLGYCVCFTSVCGLHGNSQPFFLHLLINIIINIILLLFLLFF